MSESICTSCTSLRRINTQLVSFPNGCENFFRLKQGVLTGKSTSHARSAQAACTAAPRQTPLTRLLSRRERKASGQLCRVHSTLGASPSADDSSHSTHWVRPPPLARGQPEPTAHVVPMGAWTVSHAAAKDRPAPSCRWTHVCASAAPIPKSEITASWGFVCAAQQISPGLQVAEPMDTPSRSRGSGRLTTSCPVSPTVPEGP